ncbi:MAG: membrane-associated protein [Kiritimatiellaeota bacterium]|nr:membrane-associated protein [Kiritimatiellota bacterium]
MEKLNVKALAVGLGSSWALCMLFAGWGAMLGWGGKFVEVMASVYVGLTPTFLGGIVGAVWGFADGAVGGLVIGLVYNALAKKQ